MPIGDLARSDDYETGIRATPWFSEFKAKYGEAPDLNTPDYDYRAAWAAGARPTVRDPGDGLLHWPSQFKGASHPNRFVNGVDTLTGDLQNAGYSDLGVPIGVTRTAENTADYGRGDLGNFAMGALAQREAYRPTDARGTDLWGYQMGGTVVPPQEIDKAISMVMATSGGGLSTKALAPEMGFGAATPGTFKNWLLRYSPESGAPELVNATGPTGSVFSSIKTGAPPQQMSRTLANEPAPYQHPLVDIADLQRRKASLVLGPTDRVYGGGDLTHVGKTKLETPVPQEGGINFPHLHRDAAVPGVPDDVAPLYASVSKGAASKANNAALRELEKGREPWYAPVIMGPGGSLSTNQVSNTVHQLLRQAEPSEAAIKIIDDAVRAKAAKAPGYPGFADPEKLQAWLDRGLAERRALTEGADTAAVLKATGVDVGEAVFANTDPRLYHTPSGSFGTMLGRMRPDVGVSEAPLHSNYPVTFFGQRGQIGGAAGNIPFALGAPDVHRALVPVLSPGGGSAATTPAMQVMRGGTKVQPVTQEVVDNWGEWFRRHPSGWMAAGAAPLGALAATDNYQPEERM